MINMTRTERVGLCQWLIRAGVLLICCRSRLAPRKALVMVNDYWLRALAHKYK